MNLRQRSQHAKPSTAAASNQMILPGFIGPSSTALDFNVDCSDTINYFLSTSDPASEGRNTSAMLIPTPGFIERFDLSPGPVRAQFTEPQTGRVFAVSGYQVWELFPSTFTAVVRGSVALDTNPATICANSAVGQLFITSGGLGYCYDLATDVLTTVLSSGASMGAYFETRFLSLNAVTSELRISNANDGLTWDPTQFAGRTGAGDPWVSLLVVNLDIWLFGTETSEIWYNAGESPFPFRPRPNAVIQQGVLAPFSPNAIGDTVVWVQRNKQGAGMVVRNDGYTAVKLSTAAVDQSVQGMDDATDAVSWVYQDDGQTFYVVNFPSGDIAWAYDQTTGTWCKRGFWSSTDNDYQAQRVQTHAFAAGQHFVGDRLTGAVYEMTRATALDVDGNGIRRLRRFMGFLGPEHGRVVYPQLEILMLTGKAPLSGQGANPVAMLRCSNDWGHTWGVEMWAECGKRGQCAVRVQWQRLGQSRPRAFELVISDPFPFALSQAYVPRASVAA